MIQRLELSLNLLQTALRVVYDDVAHLDAELVVSTDDTYFTASGGVARLISEKIGQHELRGELRKYTLPVPMSTAILTDAGRLGAKYVCHVATLDFDNSPSPMTSIPKTVQRVISLASALDLESIVTPILLTRAVNDAGKPQWVSQLTGEAVPETLLLIIRSLAHTIAGRRTPTTVRRITIAFYQQDTDDHLAAEQQLRAELEPLRRQAAVWARQLEELNGELSYLRPLVTNLEGDQDGLHSRLRSRLRECLDQFRQIFPSPSYSGSAVLSREVYTRQKNMLTAMIEELPDRIQELSARQAQLRESVTKLTQQRDAYGDSQAPLNVLHDLEDGEKRLRKIERDLATHRQQQERLAKELDRLEERWEKQQPTAPSDS